MEMTKQRKLLIGVLCFGVFGLVVDRFLLAPPESASADDSSEVQADADVADAPGLGIAAPETVEEPQREASSLPSYASLTERLLALQSSQLAQTPPAEQGGDDPFALPKDWSAKPAMQQTPDQAPGGDATDQAFLAKNRLVATLNDRGKQRAVVGDNLMKIGDKLDGYTLIQIAPRRVIWQSRDGQRAVVMDAKQDP